MGSKIVVSLISIILVVGVVAGVVAVVHVSRNKGDGKVSSSKRMMESLCAAATYKDTCSDNLGKVGHDGNITSQDYIKGGIKMSADEVGKGNNLADSLKSKAKDTKNATRTEAAIDQCKHWFDLATNRINGTLMAFSNNNADIFKDDDLIWEIRLLLTDVLTLADSCADGLTEADAEDLANAIRDGVKTGRELTTSMLDIITVFKDALAEAGGSADPSALDGAFAKALGGHRRLFGIPVGIDGYPKWMDRKLLESSGMVKWDKANVPIPPPAPSGEKPTPNAVVAQDGSGKFKSIMEALKTHPGNNLNGYFVIYVKAGTYKEDVLVSSTQPNVYMYGDGPRKTIVTGSKNFKLMQIGTAETAPFNVEGHNFFCKEMGFQNTAGPQGHQAVALRVNNHHSVFQNCILDAFQDTLYLQTGSHFFRDCEISGTIDFIFGNGATLIQNSKIVVRKPGDDQNKNVVTAQGRDVANENTGIVLQGCTITAEPNLIAAKDKVKTFLGRPWKQYANTIFMENEIGDFVEAGGYEEWEGKNNHETAFYGEYNNRGPGSNTANRVKWKNFKVLSKQDAEKFSAAPFLKGAEWVKSTSVPINMGLAS